MGSFSQQSILSKVIFITSVVVLLYMSVFRFIPIYKYKVVGAIYEILSLPCTLLLFLCPMFAIHFWIKEKCNFRSLYFYSILISAISITILFYLIRSIEC